MNRREFGVLAGCSLLAAVVPAGATDLVDVAVEDRARILRAARLCLQQKPVTVTAASSPRSHGGPHDYFSEGDYWWPDPKNPGGPYIRRDGFSNPDNFVAHRDALIRLSLQVPALTCAWLLTHDRNYANKAIEHLRAWFLAPETRMNSNLQFAQAISGVTTGRGIGIIDTIHLVEVSRSVSALHTSGALSKADNDGVLQWFSAYLDWINTSSNGRDEREAKNNHGTCWTMQAAAFAGLTGNRQITDFCRDRFKSVLLPQQLAPNGSFPLELERTKPYSYSLFNLDVLSTTCQILNSRSDDLWNFKLADGRGIGSALAFYAPFIRAKQSWPYAHDVEYFDDLPVRQPSLLFAGIAYGNRDYIGLWKKLNPDPTVPEIIRNYPIRQPLLWV